MKTVFIFGAGASAPAGVPMMADFVDRAERLFRENRFEPGSRAAVEDVFRAIGELQPVYAKAYLDLDNIEALFGVIEMAQLVGKLAGRDGPSIEKLRSSLVTMIVETIEQSTKLGHPQAHAAAEPYGSLLRSLKQISETRAGRALEPSFITFNYDLALDHALTFSGVPFDYGLSEDTRPRALPLLKLHGSINWGLCQEPACREIVPFYVSEAQFDPIFTQSGQAAIYNLGSELKRRREHHNMALTGPVIVPPTWNKTEYHGGLTRVWQRAAAELGSADSLIVVGYSLPESDSFFRYLFALGSTSQTRLKRVMVVNPDPDGEVARRFKGMLGRALQSRVQFVTGDEGKFENALPVIRSAIEADLAR
jgi:hypothetical protein